MAVNMAAREESKLIRNVGFFALMGIAVGQIIGAGIMSLTGVAIGMTGTGVVLAFMISPILTLVTTVPSLCLGSAVPATGGQYRYVSRLLGKKFGFVFLILRTMAHIVLALYALSFAEYFVGIVPGVNRQFVAIALLTGLYIVNMLGTKQAAIVNTGICLAMFVGIFMFIGYGVPKVDFDYVFNAKNLFTGGMSGFISSLALLSFATGGAQVIVELGGEIKNPNRMIPTVMTISTIGVGILYAGMACVAAGILPIEQTANKPLTEVARNTMPTLLFYLFMIAVALGATASTLNSQLSWLSKMYLCAAEDGLLPKWFASVNERGVPYKILTFFYVVGLLPLIANYDISFVSRVGTGSSLLLGMLVACSLMKLSSKYPKQVAAAPIRLSAKTANIVSIICMALTFTLSASLIFSLPTWAILSFFAVLGLAVLAANVALGGVEIPDDLGVDYTSAATASASASNTAQ